MTSLGSLRSPLDQRRCERIRHACLVVGIVEAGRLICIGRSIRRDLNGHGRTGHAVDPGQIGASQCHRHGGVGQRRVNHSGKRKAAQDPRRLGVFQARKWAS